MNGWDGGRERILSKIIENFLEVTKFEERAIQIQREGESCVRERDKRRRRPERGRVFRGNGGGVKSGWTHQQVQRRREQTAGPKPSFFPTTLTKNLPGILARHPCSLAPARHPCPQCLSHVHVHFCLSFSSSLIRTHFLKSLCSHSILFFNIFLRSLMRKSEGGRIGRGWRREVSNYIKRSVFS